MVYLDPLHDNQPIWIDRQDSVACLLGSQPPVRAGIAIAPGCCTVDLTGQVRSNHRIIASIVLGQHDPIMEPACLGYLVAAPQRRPNLGSRLSPIDNHSHTHPPPPSTPP